MTDEVDGDIPRSTIEREFEKAERMLADAETAREVDISKATIVNRLYYACFHAAQAVLYSRGFDPQSHGRVQTLLGREFVQQGDVDREHGRFLNDIQTYRRRADSGSGGVERETDELLRGTSAFLEAMREHVETSPDDEDR